MLKDGGEGDQQRNRVCLLHNAIIYANEEGQPGEQQTETIEGSFPTRGSIYDELKYYCIVGNYAFRKWKVTYWVGFFYYSGSYTFFFSFMLKVLFPMTIFSNLNVLQLKMMIRQWVQLLHLHMRGRQKRKLENVSIIN